jgi:hypothetical protein
MFLLVLAVGVIPFSNHLAVIRIAHDIVYVCCGLASLPSLAHSQC